MTSAEAHPLFRSAVLELTCTPAAAEVRGAGTPLATSDGQGTIADPGGDELLRAPVGFDGRADQGTNAKLDVSGPDGTPLGEVRVRKYSVGPRSMKATLSVIADGGEVARLEPQDRKGQEVAITAAGSAAGTLRRTARRGFIRTKMDYRLELTGDLDDRTRRLLVAAAIRYHALVTAACTASERRR